MAFVYHIHLPEHLGKYEEGYIGFTSTTVVRRYKEHKADANSKNSSNYPIHHAIRKYRDMLVVTTLVEGADEYCLNVENKLRPFPNMGWNIAAGGGAPMLGKKHSDSAKEKFKARSTEEFRKKLSERQKNLHIWQHGSSDPVVWATASEIYECYSAHSCEIGPVLLARAFGLGEKKLEAMLRKFRLGWIPLQDSEWYGWSADQPAKLSIMWKKGDPLLEAKIPELTDDLRAARSRGGAGRKWSEEKKNKLREANKSRVWTEESKAKLAEKAKGRSVSEETRATMSATKNSKPWLCTKEKTFWAKAPLIFEMYHNGVRVAEMWRQFELDRKSSALNTIVRRIKSGWIPQEDPAWLQFKEQYLMEQTSEQT